VTPVNEFPLDRAGAAELRRLVAEVLAEVLPGLSRGQQAGQSPGQLAGQSPGQPAGPRPGGAPATVLARGRVPSGVPAGHPATTQPAPDGAARPASPKPPASEESARPPAAAGGRPGPAPARSGSGLPPGADSWTVRIETDAELRDFALRVLRIADNPKLRRDLIAGRIRFRLADQPAGVPSQPAHRIEKGAVTERAVAAAAKAGARLVLGPRAVLTPLARDKARALGVPIEKER